MCWCLRECGNTQSNTVRKVAVVEGRSSLRVRGISWTVKNRNTIYMVAPFFLFVVRIEKIIFCFLFSSYLNFLKNYVKGVKGVKENRNDIWFSNDIYKMTKKKVLERVFDFKKKGARVRARVNGFHFRQTRYGTWWKTSTRAVIPD